MGLFPGLMNFVCEQCSYCHQKTSWVQDLHYMAPKISISTVKTDSMSRDESVRPNMDILGSKQEWTMNKDLEKIPDGANQADPSLA